MNLQERDPAASELFRRLHEGGLLVLVNAHDAGTARLVESLGAQAVATTSAGVAWSHGYPDGDALPLDLLVATVLDIARSVRVPVSVDVEGGTSDDAEAVGEAVARLVEAGAAGINIEDGAGAPDVLASKIAAIKRTAARRGLDLFVNARTDVYLRGLGPAERRIDLTLARAELYRAAGADGLFVPGLVNAEDIQAMASTQPLPLNVLARPGLPSARVLEELGVRRLSAGAALAEAAFARMSALAAAFLKNGESDALLKGAMAYADLNALMAPRAR